MVRKKDSSTCHHRSDPVVRTGKIFCAVHVKMGDAKESKQSGHPQNLLQNESIAESSHLERELLRRIMKELSRGKARRAVPSSSIPREIWLMLLRPRDPDARETITTAATEAELNNRLLQTTSSKEVGHYERNSRKTGGQL